VELCVQHYNICNKCYKYSLKHVLQTFVFSLQDMILTVYLLMWLVTGFPPRRPGFEPGSRHVGFVVDKVPLGQVFSEYFDLPCQTSFHQLLHNHHRLSSGAGTVDQTVAAVPSGFSSLAALRIIKKNNTIIYYIKNVMFYVTVHIVLYTITDVSEEPFDFTFRIKHVHDCTTSWTCNRRDNSNRN
jgi:hypothetical protein